MSYLSELLGDKYKEGMSEAEISKALQDVNGQRDKDFNALKGDLAKLNAAKDKANSEAADYKRQLRDKLSQAEKDAADKQAEWDAMTKELGELREQKFISEKTATLIGQGYTPDLAKECASAMFKNDYDALMKCNATHLENLQKQNKIDSMKGMQRPSVGSSGNGNKNYKELAAQANLEGRYAEAAYYTRLDATSGNE